MLAEWTTREQIKKNSHRGYILLGSQQVKDVAKRGDATLIFKDEHTTLGGRERAAELEQQQEVRADAGNGVYCACWKALFHNIPDDEASTIEQKKSSAELRR